MKRIVQRHAQRARIAAGFMVLAALALASSLVFAQRAEVSLDELESLFAQGKEAYDGNRLQDAIVAYTAILDAGYESSELHFNLGNTYFRSGQLGEAMLHYRNAWHLAPRDPDIEANMRFAQQHSGALAPRFSLPARMAFHLSRAEWFMVSLLAYWIGAGMLALYFWRNRRDEVIKKACMICGIALALALGGWMHWVALDFMPEYVVVDPDQKALFAPLDGSTEHFAVPVGSILRASDQSEGWLKISTGENSGWVKESACRRVYSGAKED